MSVSKFKIIAGLGNPGNKYVRTRHNIGFSVVDALADQYNLSIDKSRFDSLHARTLIKGCDVFLIKPMSYMNRSGVPLQKFAAYYKIDLEDIIVVHDDMDLRFGQIKIVKSRGHGGHNGVRSIIESFGRKDCIRVRVGVGRPGAQAKVVGHVLGGFAPDEQSCVENTVDKASKACIAILDKGITAAMNDFNSRP